jgi:hypothetical protein
MVLDPAFDTVFSAVLFSQILASEIKALELCSWIVLEGFPLLDLTLKAHGAIECCVEVK